MRRRIFAIFIIMISTVFVFLTVPAHLQTTSAQSMPDDAGCLACHNGIEQIMDFQGSRKTLYSRIPSQKKPGPARTATQAEKR